MFEHIGLYMSAVVVTVLIIAVSFVPTMFIQWKGKALRTKSA